MGRGIPIKFSTDNSHKFALASCLIYARALLEYVIIIM